MPYYQDQGSILKHQLTSEGLRVWLTVSKVGDLTYYKDGQTQVQSVPQETLYDRESLDTVWGKPITSDHPPTPVTLDNAPKYQAGMTLNSFILDNGFLTTVAVITDKKLVDSILSGEKTQVSAAYTADLIDGSGKESGKLIQTNRRYNHFAIVKRGRAGENVKVHLATDSCDVWHTDIDQTECYDMTDKIPEPQLTKVEIDKIQYDASEGLSKAVTSLQVTIRDLKASNDTLAGKLAALQMTKDSVSPDTFQYREYFEIRTLAATHQDAYDPEFTKSIPEMKLDIVKRSLSKENLDALNLDSNSPEFIDGVLQGILAMEASKPKRVSTSDSLRMLLNQDNLDNQSTKHDENDIESIRIKYASAISQNGKV